VRKNSYKKHLIPVSELITTIECDVSDFASIAAGRYESYDALYHFAWESTNNTERNNIDAQSQNIGYTLDAVRLASKLDCKKFVYAGSQAEYGRVEGLISPEIAVSPDSAYGVAKYAAGKLSNMLCGQLGVDFIWTRIFSIYGIHDKPSTMVMYCIASLLKGQKPSLTRCEQLWDYLNSRDAATALYMLGSKGKAGTIYNIGSGNSHPLVDYVHAIRDAIDPSLALGIGECTYATGQVMHLCPDISALKKDTGFVPTVTFSNGISETIEYVRNTMNTASKYNR